MNIVLVGDDRVVGEHLRRALGQTTHAVRQVAPSPSAVGMLEGPAVVCFVLFGGSAIALRLNAAKLRRRYDRRFPILVVVQKDDGSELGHALAAGADDFLVWPRDPTFMKARLDLVERRFFGSEDAPWEGIGEAAEATPTVEPEAAEPPVDMDVNETWLSLALSGRDDVVYEWSAFDGEVHLYAADSRMTQLMPLTRDVWEQGIHDDDRPMVASAMASHLRAGEPFSLTYRLRLADGRWRHVLDRASAVLVSDTDPSEPIRWVGVITDMTDRVEAQDRISREDRMEAVAHLAGGMADDYQRVLAILQRTLSDGFRYVDDEAGLLALTRARQATEKATVMTRQLASYGRRHVLQPEYISLPDVLADAADKMESRLPPNCELALELDGGVGRVLADPVQIEQVVWTLVQRACQTMPRGGTVAVDVSSSVLGVGFQGLPDKAVPGRYVKVEVRDLGSGVPNELIDRVFDPFFSAEDGGAHTGLAVPMVWSIIDQHEGFILARNLPTGGASFTFYLPVVARPPAGIRRNPTKPMGGTETVLLVDDDELIRKMAGRILKTAGYQVLLARDGLAALQVFQRNLGQVDVVLVDMVMPRLGGRDLFERMVALSPETAYMFMSGYSMSLEDADFVQRRTAQFLAKPFNGGQLLRSVRAALSQGKKPALPPVLPPALPPVLPR